MLVLYEHASYQTKRSFLMIEWLHTFLPCSYFISFCLKIFNHESQSSCGCSQELFSIYGRRSTNSNFNLAHAPYHALWSVTCPKSWSKNRICPSSHVCSVWTGGQWVQWETRPMHVQGNPLHLRKFPLHFLFCFSITNYSYPWYQQIGI